MGENKLAYTEYCEYLLNKYGNIDQPYFLNETCKSKNAKITRGNEGLFIHHIDEDKVIMLSSINKLVNWDWQQGNRLCYCNYLEHIKLHLLIFQNPQTWYKNNMCGIGGIINFMCGEINDFLFIRKKQPYTSTNQLWRNKAFECVVNNYKEYIDLLKQTCLQMIRYKLPLNEIPKLWMSSTYTGQKIILELKNEILDLEIINEIKKNY